MRTWYVVHTQPRAEDRALSNLRRQGYLAYLPKYLKRRSHARRVDWVSAPMFPRYLFVSFDPSVDAWRSISSTIGVSYLVTVGERPVPVPDGTIEAIREREDGRGLVSLVPQLKRGDAVMICGGAFANQSAMFDCASDDERIIVLLNLLGRNLKIELRATDICAAA